jgi:4'-phosphopantetheinyl transferase EntD
MIPELGLPSGIFSTHFSTAFAGPEVLSAAEFELVKTYAPKRIGDFASGRSCARKALDALGVKNAEILKGEHNEPLWPEGFIGSISHTHDMAGAIVGRSAQVKGIGLDIEHLGRVKPGMWDILFSEYEKNYLHALPEKEQAVYTTALFSMKESFYKLQFPITRTSLWFHDVEISEQNGAFRLLVLKDFDTKHLLPEYTPMHFVRSGELIISYACLLHS